MPLLISERDWAVDRGLRHPTRLKYFDSSCSPTSMARANWSKNGFLPAAAGDRQFRLSAPHGRRQACVAGAMSNVYAADLGRGPDGQWWVLNDRSGAPLASATPWKTV